MYIVYYEPVGYGLYKESKQFDDAMNAFHFANKQAASCVVDGTDRSYNIFRKNEFGVNVAEQYEQEWRRENCAICGGSGKVTDGQEWYVCGCST